MKQKVENIHGITLISLVISIIVLIILIGVSIAILTGKNSLFERAKQAKLNYSVSSSKEKLELAISNLIIEQASKGENTSKEDLTKINDEEIDVGSTDKFPVEVICEKYKFAVDENFVVTYIGDADGIIVTYTTNPEGYTNGDSIKILIKVTSSKGIKSIQKPGEIDRLLAQGQKTIGLDYEVTKNGHYIFTIVDLEDNEIQKDIYIDKFDKIEPLEFTPEIKKEGYNITVIENGKDSEETEDSAKSGIDYYKYFLIDSTGKEIEYEINKIEDLDVGNYKLYLIAYDRAGNCKKSNVLEFFISRKYKEISVGYNHCLAIDYEGNLWSWGLNDFGQLGNNMKDNKIHDVPVQIVKDKKFVKIAAGYLYSMAIDEEGNLWTCGYNRYGQLGDGTNINKSSFVKISMETKFAQISAGNYHCLAIDVNGNLWAWGQNNVAQLGDETRIDKNSPVQVISGTYFKDISAGENHSLAIDSEGNLWGWGDSSYGQAGVKNGIRTPGKIKEETKFMEISAGRKYSLAIDSEGKLWAVGYNYFGQLGDGTTVDKNSFIQIASDKKFVHISSGDSSSFGIDNEGNNWAWGKSGYFLGIGTYDEKVLVPMQVKIETKLNLIKSNGCNLALDIDGSMWAWGYNGNGQYGNGTKDSVGIPIQIK